MRWGFVIGIVSCEIAADSVTLRKRAWVRFSQHLLGQSKVQWLFQGSYWGIRAAELFVISFLGGDKCILDLASVSP